VTTIPGTLTVILISVGSVSAAPGDIVDIPVQTALALPSGIFVWEFELAYDTTALAPESPYYATTGTLSSGFSVTPSFTPTSIKLLTFGTSELPQNAGVIVYFKFRVKSGAVPGTYPLTLHVYAPPAITKNGTLTVIKAGIQNRVLLPDSYYLGQNYPNPFNSDTNIPFSVKQTGRVLLTLYDVQGRLVAVLMDRVLPAGAHRITISLDNLSAGVYFYRMQINGYTSVRKMILLK
jgi:hypothetical protein